MKNIQIKSLLRYVFLGKRYSELQNINDQVRYLTLNYIFIVVTIPLVILGFYLMSTDIVRTIVDLGLAALLILGLILVRSKLPIKLIPIVLVPVFGAYCLYLLYEGILYHWTAVWIFIFPLISIFLCEMTMGCIYSVIIFLGAVIIMYTPIAKVYVLKDIRFRILIVYVLVLALSIIYEYINTLKDKKEKQLKAELANERDMIQTMKDNINQGIFLMDKDMKILPQYSQPLTDILSYYDSDIAGKSFLDILSSSFESKELQFMKGYFTMVFEKTKSAKVLESANPIAEFEYKTDAQSKTLSTRFSLIEQANTEPVIIGIIQDMTREKEFERELQSQKAAQELEMKNMFDVIKVDPLVFQNFIEDTESNYNSINAVLKDRSLTEKQVVTKVFQYIHAIKSNAVILGLEHLGNKIHILEDAIKAVSNKDMVSVEDVLGLTIKLETLMQEMDAYTAITKRISAYKTSNQMDTILVNSISKAAERLSGEVNKKVEVKAGQIDLDILESKLRKPIKEILYQCVRNSIYHGIETADERIKKNKPPRGLLVFGIKKVDGKAEVTFSDDGSGLNWDKIRKKYLIKHPEARNVDKKVLLGAIFAPEFSTADETSTAAGRGVGLSLVMDLIKENHGAINVNSTESGLMLKFTFPMS